MKLVAIELPPRPSISRPWRQLGAQHAAPESSRAIRIVCRELDQRGSHGPEYRASARASELAWQGASMDFDLDAWLPEPQVRTRHRRSASAAAGDLWHSAMTLRIGDAPIFGKAVRWRIPDTSPDLSFRDLLRRYPFVVIGEGDRWSVSGLCGRVWTLQRDYPNLDGPEEFRAWDEPGTVRVLVAHWIEPDGNGRSALVSETRVEPIDRQAAIRMRALWMVVGRFDRFIAREVLRNAARRAERSGGPVRSRAPRE
jgi:hypothetical protein